MILKDRVDRLDTLAQQLKDVSEQEIQTDSLTKRAKIAQDWKKDFKRLLEQLQGFRELNIQLMEPPRGQAFEAVKALKSVSGKTHVQGIMQSTQGDPYLFLNRLKERLEARIDQAWRQYLQEHTLQVEDGILDVLSGTLEAQQRANDIRRIYRELSFHKRKAPATKSDMLKVKHLQEQMVENWQALTRGELPTEVLNFLQSVTNPGGVKLSALTPEVLKWLADHQLLQQFRVSPVKG